MNFDRVLFITMTVLLGLMFVSRITYNFYSRSLCKPVPESSSLVEPAPALASGASAEPHLVPRK